MVPRHPDVAIDVGIFGGSGLYTLLDDAREVPVNTPYGAPAAAVVVGTLDGRRVGFMPRHGVAHELPPHAINFRANLWAMKHLGASDVILPCAAGSLQPQVAPGHFVVADQVVDRTSGRKDTYFDGPDTIHVALDEPYDEEMRGVALTAARDLGLTVHDRGTIVVIQGPRFSTKAESRWYAAMGWEVVNMTAYPEVALARELEMAALNISLITDYDVGVAEHPAVEPVSQARVMEMFRANLDSLRDLLFAIVPALPLSPDRPALSALAGAHF